MQEVYFISSQLNPNNAQGTCAPWRKCQALNWYAIAGDLSYFCKQILQEPTFGINQGVILRVRNSNTKQQVLQFANTNYVPCEMTRNKSHSTWREKMKDNQHEQLFTELTPAEAAIIEGGISVINSTIDFDFSQRSRNFAVTNNDPAVSLSIGRLTKRGDDGRFVATLKEDRKFRPDRTVGSATVFSNSTARFGRQPKGNYYIQFTDKKDGKRVAGPVSIVVD